MKKILIGLALAAFLGGAVAIAAPAYHWLTDHGMELGYECGVWTGKWTVTAGAHPLVAAVLTSPRADGNTDFCFAIVSPRAVTWDPNCNTLIDPTCHP